MTEGFYMSKKNGMAAELDAPIPKPPRMPGIDKSVVLPAIAIQEVKFQIVGDSALICHRKSDSVTKQIRDKQQQKAVAGRAAKDPEKDYQESMYRTRDGRCAFPASGLKKAAVDACTFIKTAKKTEARGAFHVIGDMLPITGEPRMREDMVMLRGGGSADLRYRAEFPQWRINISIRFNANVISAEQVINLFNVAGFGVGIGDWRPQKSGSFGMFHVEAVTL
jgi:hypothetical protein